MPRKAEAPDNVSALQRGFEVLDCVAAARAPLGNAEIAAATGIPRPTVSRLMATLVTLGHLRPAADGEKYELAAGVVRLAQAFLSAVDVRAQARPHLLALAEATGASAFLGVRDGDEMLVVEGARARDAVAVMGADIGTRMNLATSALGRAWLAGVDAGTRDAVLARWRRRSKDHLAVAAAIDSARRAGVAVSLGEWHPSIHAAAVPVRTPRGQVVSVNCGGPAFLWPADRFQALVIPQLLAAAEAFAADIGGVAGAALTRAEAPSDSSDPTNPPGARRRPGRSTPTSAG